MRSRHMTMYIPVTNSMIITPSEQFTASSQAILKEIDEAEVVMRTERVKDQSRHGHPPEHDESSARLGLARETTGGSQQQ